MNGNNGSASYNAICFESFGVQHIPKQSKKFIRNKNIITNIYKVEAYYSVMCEYFCIGFIDFMVKSKILLDYAFFSPNEYEKNDKIILKYFHKLKGKDEKIILRYLRQV